MSFCRFPRKLSGGVHVYTNRSFNCCRLRRERAGEYLWTESPYSCIYNNIQHRHMPNLLGA